MKSTATSRPLVCSSEYGSASDLAELPGSGGVAHQTPVNLLTRLLRGAPVEVFGFALLLAAVWLIADPRTPDLAAQVYRADLFRRYGFMVWDEHWYAGHQMPGYSLLFPPLGALLGVRLLGALAVLASTSLFWGLVRPIYGANAARWGGVFFALAAVGDVWAGRVTFALGVPFALGAILALRCGNRAWGVLLGVLCAAASPVAGALLGLAALTWTLAERRREPLLLLAIPPGVVVVVLALLFPEGGVEPFPILSFAATALVVVAFLGVVPARERMLRIGGALYLGVCVLCLVVHSPVGSNIERYGVLLAGPLLACAVLSRRDDGARARGVVGVGGMTAVAVTLALAGSAVWVVWGPARETLAVAGSEATSTSYYAPVEHFLEGQQGGPVRVEVPLTRSHWEAALLAPGVSLARGWEKQLDSKYDGVLLAHGLTAAGYEGWLKDQGVSYVALPDVRLDPSSAQEGRLIRGGVPYLREVFSSAHWHIYAVQAPTPLAAGPGRLTSLGHDSFALDVRAPGSFLVRVHFSRYLFMSRGRGCVEPAQGGWTQVSVRSAGEVVVRAGFSLGRAFSSGGSCS